MNRARIKKELKKQNWSVIVPGADSILDFAEHIAKLARSEALEEAAKMVRIELDKKSCPDAYMAIAVESIQTLKETS